jgi:phenylalanyl-tRNA synthetase beta chain
VLKGIVESLLQGLHVPIDIATADAALLEAGAGMLVSSGSASLGTLGILDSRTATLLGLEHETFYAELSVEALSKVLPAISFKEFSRFPSIRRDIAVVVDSVVPAGQLEAIIRDNAGPLLKAVTVFDSFQGGSLPPGKKSIGFSMEFTSPDRTLMGEQVDALVTTVEAALKTRVGGVLRRT